MDTNRLLHFFLYRQFLLLLYKDTKKSIDSLLRHKKSVSLLYGHQESVASLNGHLANDASSYGHKVSVAPQDSRTFFPEGCLVKEKRGVLKY